MKTQAQLAKLDDQALFREFRAIKAQEIAVYNAKNLALEEFMRRGLVSRCCVCQEPIDPHHARRFLSGGAQRHAGCAGARVA